MVCKFRSAAVASGTHEVFQCSHFNSKCTEIDLGMLNILQEPLPVCEGCKARIEIVPIEGTGTKSNFCYFSCDTTPQGAGILGTMVASARAAGVQEDFHVFSHKPVEGATTHSPGPIDIKHHIFKWKLLRDRLANLPYDYFVWIDSDTIFTRHPGNLKNLIRDNAMWCQLESETTAEKVRFGDWWGAKIDQYNQTLTNHGVTSEKKYNTNGGMWIVRRNAIDTFVRQALSFHAMCLAKGLDTTSDEPPLAWLGQVQNLSGYGPWVIDPHLNTQEATCETWACDWNYRFAGRIPDGGQWECEDWLTGEKRLCNPAIVHAMRSKDAMAIGGTANPEPVGTKLSEILMECGIGDPTCGECKAWVQRMNLWGIAGCQRERTGILTRLSNEAAKASWISWGKVAARGYMSVGSLLDEAISRARAA